MSGSLATNLDANGDGLTALDYRKILQGVYPNPGIVSGGTVTGNSSLTYHVPATVAVIDRGSDGTRLVYYAGGDTPAVEAGDASNRRIDVIWLKANDPALDGGSKEVVIGVTQGTPSANPVVPTLDSGQLALMEKLVQPGTTNLSTGSGDNRSYNYAIPYGASMGCLAYGGRSNNDLVNPDGVFRPYINLDFTIPSDRLIEFVWEANVGFRSSSQLFGSYYLKFILDGITINNGNDEVQVTNNYIKQQYSVVTAVSGSGTHNISVQVATNKNRSTGFYMNNDGAKLRVWDRGVAQ